MRYKYWLGGVLVLLGLLIGRATVSFAQCPDGSPGDDTLDCTGADVDGVTTDTGNDTLNLNGNTITSPTVGVDATDSVSVNGAGTITVTGVGAGIVTSNGTATNSADINTQADGSAGIAAFDGGSNSGNITAQGDFSVGFTAANSASNSGTITMNGASSAGMEVLSGNASNTGTILILNDDSVGITVCGSATNNGTIVVTGDFGIGIDVCGGPTINSGNIIVTGDGPVGILGTGDLTNTGSVRVNGDSGAAIANDGNVTSSGDVIANGISVAIITFVGNDTITITAGTVSGGTSIDAQAGDDTVIISLDATIIGTMDGNLGFDTLTFSYSSTSEEELLAFQNFMAGVSVTDGAISYGGKTYTWVNFEGLSYLVALLFLDSQGGGAERVPGLICDDGVTKWFRLPNGDVEAYSGFNIINVPNGFLVGVVIRAQLPGVLRFQDVGGLNPGWYVEVTPQVNGSYIGQVFDQNNNPIGKSCPF